MLLVRREGRLWSCWQEEDAEDNATNLSVRINLPFPKNSDDFPGTAFQLQLHEQCTFEDKDAVNELSDGAQLAIDVGSFLGGSAHAILSNESVKHLICIDSFCGTPSFDPETGEPCSPTARIPGWMTFLSLNARLAEFNGRYSIWVGLSQMFSRIAPKADFVFIDAALNYEAVKDDIASWVKVVKPGGILAGHDFDKPLKDETAEELVKWIEFESVRSVHPGVALAVRESFEHFELVEQENSSVWWAKPEWFRNDAT